MASRRHPSDIQDERLLAVLDKYLPPIIGRSIVERARREAISGPDVSWADPNGLLDRISVGVRLFAAPDQQGAILREVTDLAIADREGPPSSRLHAEVLGTNRPSSSGVHRDPPPTRREPAVGSAVRPQSKASSVPPAQQRPPTGPPIPQSDVYQQQGPSKRDDAAPPSRGVYPTSLSYDHFTPGQARGRGPAMVRIPAIPPPGKATPPAGIPRTPSPAERGRAPGPAAPGAARGPSRVQIIGGPPHGQVGPPRGIRGVLPRPKQHDSGEPPREITIALMTEHDIPLARQLARDICERLGTRALTQQRLLTIVSELGRNMVLYAGGGKMTLRPPNAKSRRIVVIAVDQGPGIADLAEIMAGRYKSRSGLGLGLLGTKRLADSFHVDTGRGGTAVTVEVIL